MGTYIIVGISCFLLGGLLGILTMCLAISVKELDA